MKKTDKWEGKNLKAELAKRIIWAIAILGMLIVAIVMVVKQEKFLRETKPLNAVTIVDLPELTNDLK